MGDDGGETIIVGGIMLILFTVFVIGGCVGSSQGVLDGKHAIRTEAVEKGYAEWQVAPDGTTTFQWKE